MLEGGSELRAVHFLVQTGATGGEGQAASGGLPTFTEALDLFS